MGDEKKRKKKKPKRIKPNKDSSLINQMSSNSIPISVDQSLNYIGVMPVMVPPDNRISKKSQITKLKVKATDPIHLRHCAGKTWIDRSLTDWPDNDFRVFVGDLGNEVSDAMLTTAFSKYPSFSRAKVIRDKRNGK